MAKAKLTPPQKAHPNRHSVISEIQKELKAQASARRSKELTRDSRHQTKDGSR